MLNAMNRRITLASRPVGVPQESDFALDEVEIPEPAPGEVHVRALYVSLDPYQRGRMSEARSYARSLELSDVITSQTLGQVVTSHDSRFQPGQLVVGQLGWQEHAVARGGALRPVPSGLEPPTLALHVVGTTGLTAYIGLFDVGKPHPGDTVVVSAAHGAVGQIAGQLAKLTGCRTIGIAGGAEKVRELRELYGYDVAIDYRQDDVAAALRGETVNVYFDNVGGDISHAVHRRLAIGARIVICGQISQYNIEPPQPTFHPGTLIVFRARMEGFLVSDHAHRFGDASKRLVAWVADGSIRYREDVTDGLENAPRAWLAMMRGENRGKALVKVADPS
jgi:NADPH-dependent curcumin reductase CurA